LGHRCESDKTGQFAFFAMDIFPGAITMARALVNQR
jgi:hypothetical protein